PGIGGDARLPPQTLAPGDVLSIRAVADRYAALRDAEAGARPAALHRPLSRSGLGHGQLRIGPVGASSFLCRGVPRRLAARRFFAERAGLGFSTAQLRPPPRGRLPSV